MPNFTYGLLLPSQRVADEPSPAAELVSVAEAKRSLAIDDDDHDELIASLIAAAIAWLDAPEGWLGRSLKRRTVVEYRDCFWSDALRLPYPPVRSVVSIDYIDIDGVSQTVPGDRYQLVDGSLDLVWGAAWPSCAYRERGVRISYEVGYDVLPAPIKQAILLLVGQWFHTRSAVRIGEAVNVMPFSVEALLSPFRVWS